MVTVMSNMGFFKFCDEYGIKCSKTAVGDRYVLERALYPKHEQAPARLLEVPFPPPEQQI